MIEHDVTTSEYVRQRLIEVGGRTSQDLGLGRIVGQILVFLYLREEESSLDEIGEELGISKAAASIAARQLETLGLLHRVWKRGDRRSYYRTADNLAAALQQGLFAVIRQKTGAVAAELDHVSTLLDGSRGEKDRDLEFLRQRVTRAKTLRDKAARIMENPLVKLFMKA